MSSERFYLDLQAFSDFRQVTKSQWYQEIPNDWSVVVTDIKGSTSAIESGRYKDVNMIGAATIVCAQNAMHGLDFPFVFGGDGATLIIPPSQIEKVQEELLSLREMARVQFDLELRVGAISVSELQKFGGKLQIAKFEFVSGQCVALFKGGGLSLAEKIIKSQPSKYFIKEKNAQAANLNGLSCRWQPIQNKNGHIVSLLVVAQSPQQNEIYAQVLEKLEKIFNGNLEVGNPVNLNSLRYQSFLQCYKSEKRLYQKKISLKFLGKVMGMFCANLIFKFKIPLPFFNRQQYTESMRTHSDYRKFDDMLRMVIDCSDKQLHSIQLFLQDLHSQGEVFFGIHTSQSALMTCYVRQTSAGNHIHFIDGGDGGYALAAKQLKKQIQAATEAASSSQIEVA